MPSEDALPHAGEPWNPVNRSLYRIVSVYVFLYAVRSLLIVLSFIHAEFTHHFVFFDDQAFKYLVPWVAKHILQMQQPLTSSVAGDASFQWVEQFVLLAISLTGAVVWSVADRKRPDYRVLDHWLRLIVRLALASILFAYGFDKVFPNQFGSITRYDLIRQFGDLSHFNLMWNFMAASKGYTIFSGLLEVVAGILLLVPALASAGAFLSIVVMANVVALNLAYNIPVKLLSTNFLLLAVYLAAPELPRLLDLLVWNKAVGPHPLIPLSSSRRLNRGVAVGQMVLGVVFFASFFYAGSQRFAERRRAAAEVVPLQGIWLVDDFTVAGGPQRALFTPKLLKSMEIPPGEERWSKLVFDEPGTLVIQTVNGELDFVDLKLNPAGNEALLTDSGDASWKADLKLQRSGPNFLGIQGVVDGLTLNATLHKMDESRFKVRDEGLHLIQPGR